MAVEYKWLIVQLETKPQEGDLQDVVSIVHWRRSATDGIYFIDECSTMGCATPSATDFTAYPDLTKEQVETWLNEGTDVEAIDARLLQAIENLKNPPIVVLPLPWA
jgi:hypothetical protein